MRRRDSSFSGAKSRLQSLDLATRSNSKFISSSVPRRLQFNDTVEVYYYPENKEQHAHHDSDYEFEDESLACSEAYDLQDEAQECADPDFEEMLQDYIKHSLLPKL